MMTPMLLALIGFVLGAAFAGVVGWWAVEREQTVSLHHAQEAEYKRERANDLEAQLKRGMERLTAAQETILHQGLALKLLEPKRDKAGRFAK